MSQSPVRGVGHVPLLFLLLALAISVHVSLSVNEWTEKPIEPTPAETTAPQSEEPEEEKGPVLTFLATAYSLPGQTASGAEVRKGIVAADPDLLPLGSLIHIPAGRYSGLYTVLDTGRDIQGRRLDIWMPTVQEARAFGVRRVKVRIVRRGWDPTERRP